jgi:hypothetical protein
MRLDHSRWYDRRPWRKTMVWGCEGLRERWKSSPGGLGVGCCSGVVVGLWEGGVAVAIMIDSGWS